MGCCTDKFKCIKCGKLLPILSFRLVNTKRGHRGECRACERSRKWVQSNESRERWKKANPEKCREYKKRWYEKNKQKKESAQYLTRANLQDSYIVALIKSGTGLAAKDVRLHTELIELKRIHLATSRLIKERNHEKY